MLHRPGKRDQPARRTKLYAERLTMPKRNLRAVKRAKDIPLLGICEYCNAQFPADPHRLGQLGDAQASIQEQFDAKPSRSM